VVAAMPPVVTRTEPGVISGWEAEVAADADGKDIVWKSKSADGKAASLVLDSAHGEFTGSRAGKTALAANTRHWLRVRQTSQADWPPRHSPFITGVTTGNP